jgi:hypothetical protein
VSIRCLLGSLTAVAAKEDQITAHNASKIKAKIIDEGFCTIPAVIYVSPAGSRAASAGVFITLSAHIAAMTHRAKVTIRLEDAFGDECVTRDFGHYS